MSQTYLSRDQVRQIDRRASEEFGVPSIVLMENAGRGAAELLLSLGASGPVMICCGKGNNGGDGLVVARHLDNHGVAIRVLLFANPDELTGDAAVNCRIVQRTGLPLVVTPKLSELQTELSGAEWVVDALFGTGLLGPVRPPLDEVIAKINASGKPVLAIDIPSGLDCDTGLASGATIRATHTVTFVASKVGFSKPSARQWLGQVHVAHIGAPRSLIQDVSRS
jgi:NAD(P)H-hydrate epimerase